MRIHLIAAALFSTLTLAALPARAQPKCPSGQQSCTHADGTPRCFNLDRDQRHCGRCGNECRREERCEHGRCTGGNRCDRGQTLCQADDGAQRCFDLDRDERHCGRCGNHCRHHEKCRDGSCRADCPGGQTFCPQRRDGSAGCTDTRSDPYNCGRCGNACPSVRPRCRDGRCS